MTSGQFDSPPSSFGGGAAVQAHDEATPMLDPQADDRDGAIVKALCSQLDRVLEELWAFAERSEANGSVALAQLALRVCCLYPRSTSTMRQRVAQGAQVLEVHGFDLAHGRGALPGPARIRMTRREAALLHYLIGHRDRIVSREELMKEVWQRSLTGAAARTIDIHVHRLRRKLGDEFALHLETIRNVGYVFSTVRP